MERLRANVWIASGAIVVALATGLSRAGDYSFVYAGELVGIAAMFAGFKLTAAPRKAPAPSVQPRRTLDHRRPRRADRHRAGRIRRRGRRSQLPPRRGGEKQRRRSRPS